MNRQEKSLRTLQRLLGPILTVRVERWRRRKRRLQEQGRGPLLTEATLKCTPLFSKWTAPALRKLSQSARVVCRTAGSLAAPAGEPQTTTSVFWVASGKLMQVPTKKEISWCAISCPGQWRSKAAKTGSLVFPSLFSNDTPSLVQRLTPQQEAVLKNLKAYTTGDFVDLDELLLGAARRRAIRCQTDVVLVEIRQGELLREVHLQRSAVTLATLQEARSTVVANLTACGERPSVASILRSNPILTALHPDSVKSIHQQLSPSVFSAGELICADESVSETVSFLLYGQVRRFSATATPNERVVTSETGSAIGLASFIVTGLSAVTMAERSVSAGSYCVTWGIRLSTLLKLCDEWERASCARLAEKQLGTSSILISANVLKSLRQVTAFCGTSEDTLRSIARGAHLRVHTAGKCVQQAKRRTTSGVILLCGRCHFSVSAQDDVVAERVPAPCGVPVGFCEAIVGVALKRWLFADTCTVALHYSSAAVLSALDEARASEAETRAILDAAQAYVSAGTHLLSAPVSAAQLRAEERIRAFQKQAAAEDMQTETFLAAPAFGEESGVLLAELQVHNHILSSVSLQLQSIHTHSPELEHFTALRDSPECRRAGEGRVAVPAKHPHRNHACFNIDDDGCIVFSTEEKEVACSGHSSPSVCVITSPRKTAVEKRVLEPHHLPLLCAARDGAHKLQTRGHVVSAVGSTASPPALPQCRADQQTWKAAEQRCGGPWEKHSKVAAMRKTVQQMQDVANGFDANLEYRRHTRKARLK